MALMVPLCIALIGAFSVSALVIDLPVQIQEPNSEPGSVHRLSGDITAHGSTNDSVRPLTTSGGLDHGYNASLSRLNLSAQTVFDCDEGWGRDLTPWMCGEAVASIPQKFKTGLRSVSFGPRGANTFDIGLPRRWMSSDGICGIQPFLMPGEESARVPTRNTYVAATTLIQRCVGGTPSMGGQALNFGGDNNLLVAVTEYDPHLWSNNVRCFGSTGAPRRAIDSCNNLADRMQTSESSKTFGPRGDYLTPYTISPDNRCSLTISSQPSNRYKRTASWYEIWEGVVLVNAICIRHGMQGTFKVYSDGAPNVVSLVSNQCLPVDYNIDMETSWLQLEVGPSQATNNLTLLLTDV